MHAYLVTDGEMKPTRPNRPITIFTPSFADEENTNAQNLTVKEIVARLPPEQFRVIMISEGKPDPRIAARKNTKLLPYYEHGNTAQLLMRSLAFRPDIYFYPRFGPLDQVVFALRKNLRLRTAVVTHIVSVMNNAAEKSLVARSIVEGDAVFANSAYVAETVRQRFGVRAGTIYNGIDRRFFFPGAEPASTSNTRPLTVALRWILSTVEACRIGDRASRTLAECAASVWRVAVKPRNGAATYAERTNAAMSPFWGICHWRNLAKKCEGQMFFFSLVSSRVIRRCSDKRLLAACRQSP